MQKLWCERYRPRVLDDMVFAHDAERATFKAIINTGELPNLLLVGHQGTGKTSLSGVLLNELNVLLEDVLRVNCSDEKIDAVRDKVKSFAYTMSTGPFKVVQLEELDYIGNESQALLRSLIEDVSSACRFIATANYANRLLPAIRSRFQEFTFSAPSKDEVMIRAADILERENIEFDLEILENMVAASYPDVRKLLQLLEQSSRTGKLKITNTETASDWKLALLPLLETGDLKTARKMVCESASKEELQDIYRFLYSNIHRVKKLTDKIDQAVVMIADYQFKSAFVADQEINIAALFIELGAL